MIWIGFTIAKKERKRVTIPESNKGMDEDFLIISSEWHDGLHCPTQDGEPSGVPEDLE